MGKGRMMRTFLFTLFAVAGLGLLSQSCEFFVDNESDTVVMSDADGFSADTLALLDGHRLLEEKQYDLARERLTESSHSDNIHIRIKSFLYLNALEMELENYDAARLYLEEYHIEAMQLFYRAMDRQQEMTEQIARLGKRHRWLVNGFTGVAVLMLGGAVFFVWRQWWRGMSARNGKSSRQVANGANSVSCSPTDISDRMRYLTDAD
jgi:hypothetical protein